MAGSVFDGKRIVIFDMDGTLIDSVGVWNEVDRRLAIFLCGRELDPSELQRKRDSALRRLSGAADPYLGYCELLKAEYGSPLSAEEILRQRYIISHRLLTDEVHYKPGAPELLRRLRSDGLTLIIASTTRRNNMDIYRNRNESIMSTAPIDRYFSKIYVREDAERIKPDPLIYLRAMSDAGALPEECIVFEDSLVGVQAAHGAGIEVAAMYDRYSDSDRAQINALSEFIFSDYFEVIRSLDNA